MKKLIFTLSILLLMAGCDMVFHQPKDGDTNGRDTTAVQDTIVIMDTIESNEVFTQFQFDSAFKVNNLEKLEDFKKTSSIPGASNRYVYLCTIRASDPEKKRLLFTVLVQPVKGMFTVNDEGDMFIYEPMLLKIHEWYGQKLPVLIACSDGVNARKAVMTFIVGKLPGGKYTISRQIA